MGGDGGWVLVGPGSEWFWSMVGNVVPVVTLVVYLQLRADRATRTLAQAQAQAEEWWSITGPYLERDRERHGVPAHLAGGVFPHRNPEVPARAGG